MLISRFTTIYLIPLALFMSTYGLLPLSLKESIFGALFGYLFLLAINTIFKYWRNIDGIGEGDFDLLLFIGSFTGMIGCWISITIGSILGALYGITILLFTQQSTSYQSSIQTTKIPFGPFLACGAIIFVFLQNHIFNFLLIH